MAVSNELVKPETEGDFESMCHALYRRMWNDTSCTRVGGGGQSQFGVDILGHDGKTSVGIQCKHYVKKQFSLATVSEDVKLADDAKLDIGHMLFATTAANKSGLVIEVRKLSDERKKAGKFTVSVDFWDAIEGHLRVHPEVGKAYIRNFPGAPILEIQEATTAHLRLYEEGQESTQHFQSVSIENQTLILDKVNALTALATGLTRGASPDARGDEADPRVVASLDFIRDRLREGKCREASELLAALGDPRAFKDQFSQFRWRTNHAAVALLEGRIEDAATEFLDAFNLAPEHEKALANRTHAYLIRKNLEAALGACDDGLVRFPQSSILWALKLNIRMLQGDAEPEKDLPEALRGIPDLLYTVAHLKERRGDSPAAVALLQRCLQSDGASFEAKRAYLAATLGWAAKDAVLAYHGQFTSEQRSTLSDAIARFEPIEQTLPAIQSDIVSLEVTNNACLALMLLGDIDRARSLAMLSLRRHPLSEGLLRVRLTELEQHEDWTAVHALTDNRLAELPPTTLGSLAEISANKGDVAWHACVIGAAEASPEMEPDMLRELRALSIHAQWVAGARNDAITAAETYSAANPDLVLPRVILGTMLLRQGRKNEALQQASSSASQLDVTASSLQVLQVAELFFHLAKYDVAASLYARLVKLPGDDEFTRKWLICLIESDQRRRALDLLSQLEPQVRALPAFVRIEANLARRAGDWARMRELLTNEIKRTPADSSVALGYVGALYRLAETSALSAYLESDPSFENASPENEFEFSKYQARQGLGGLALRRIFRLYRRRPSNGQVASLYLGQILVGPRLDELDVPTEVRSGTVAYLRTSSQTRIVAIDIDIDERNGLADSWSELVSADSNLAQSLIGHKVGDHVAIGGVFGETEVELVAIESIYTFAANKAHEQVAAAAVPAGPLWSVKVVKDDGELDIEPLLESAKQRKGQVRNAFESYRAQCFPVSMLARAIGSDPVTLMLEWPFREASLFVGIGTREERDAAEKILQQGTQPYVLDLLTIAELSQRGAFEAGVKLLRRPLVPQTVREQLQGLIELAGGPRGSASMSEEDGRLQMTETPAAYYEHREQLLKQMLQAIDEHCEVVPAIGPKDISSLHRVLAAALDHSTMDALYLAGEREAVLVSEDGALRMLAPSVGIEQSVSAQAVLAEACAQGLLSRDAHATAVVGKLNSGHDFVSVRAEDISAVACRTPLRVSSDVRTALEAFRKPTLEIVSGVIVGCGFLLQASKGLQPSVLAEYGALVLEGLQYGRPSHADVIHRAVAQTLQQAIDGIGRRALGRDRRLFTRLLNAPGKPVFNTQPTTIAIAIQAFLGRNRHLG
jgi:Flp pilus assembly protein TadD